MVGGAELSGVFKKQIYDIVGLVFSGLFVFGIVCLFVCVCVCACVCGCVCPCMCFCFSVVMLFLHHVSAFT